MTEGRGVNSLPGLSAWRDAPRDSGCGYNDGSDKCQCRVRCESHFLRVSRPGFTKGRVAKELEGVETKHEEDDVVGRADAVGRCRICAGEPARRELQRHRNLRSHGTWRRECATDRKSTR